MSCSYFQELISALIDDELDEKEVFYLQGHLRNCVDCQQYLLNLGKFQENFKQELLNDVIPRPSLDFAKRISSLVKGGVKREVRVKEVFIGFLGTSLEPKKIFSMVFSMVAIIVIIGIIHFGVKDRKTKTVYEILPVNGSQLTRDEYTVDSYLQKHVLASLENPLGDSSGIFEFVDYSEKKAQ